MLECAAARAFAQSVLEGPAAGGLDGLTEEPGGNRGVRKQRATTTAHQQVWVGKWRSGPGRHGCWAVARRKGWPGSGGEGNPGYQGTMSPLVSGKERSGVERWREGRL